MRISLWTNSTRPSTNASKNNKTIRSLFFFESTLALLSLGDSFLSLSLSMTKVINELLIFLPLRSLCRGGIKVHTNGCSCYHLPNKLEDSPHGDKLNWALLGARSFINTHIYSIYNPSLLWLFINFPLYSMRSCVVKVTAFVRSHSQFTNTFYFFMIKAFQLLLLHSLAIVHFHGVCRR